MADIRMPDGTLITGVPDGVSKSDLDTKLLKKYGQERFDVMTGGAASATAPSEPASATPVMDQPASAVPEPQQPASAVPEPQQWQAHPAAQAPLDAPAAPVAEPTVRAQLEPPIIPASTSKYAENYKVAATRHGHPVAFMEEWAKTESTENPNAVSPDGAGGLIQIMPATAKELGLNNPFDVDENLDKGSLYLRKKLDEFDGDIEKGIAAYHSGAGNVRKAVRQQGANWLNAKAMGPKGRAYVKHLAPLYRQFQKAEADGGAGITEEQHDTAQASLREPVATTTGSSGGVLGLQQKLTAAEKMQEQGAKIKRMTDLKIYGPERYGLTQDQIDAAAADSVTARAKAKAGAGQDDESKEHRADVAKYNAALADNPELAKAMYPEIHSASEGKPVTNDQLPDEMRTWGKYADAAITSTDDQIGAGLKLNAATNARLKAQELNLGQVFFEQVANRFPDLSDDAFALINKAASQYGLTAEQYARFTASMVESATEQEQQHLDEYADIIEMVQSHKPRSAEETLLGGWAAMALENLPQMGYIFAGVAMRSPLTTMSLMSTDVYARTYANARQSGRDPSEAAQDAFASVLIEAGTEGIPVSRIANLVRRGQRSKAKMLLEGLGVEGTQEMLAEFAGMLYDINVLDEEITFGEAVARLRDAGVLGAFMGSVVSAPVIAFSDPAMVDADEAVADAKKQLKSVATRVMDPSQRGTTASRAEAKEANDAYITALKAKRALILKRKEEKSEKAKAKMAKKDTKRKAKLTPLERQREAAQEKQQGEDQTIRGAPTKSDVRQAETLRRAAAGELEEADVEPLKEVLDAGYVKITKAGTLIVLPAGKARMQAVDAAVKGAIEPVSDEVIEPVPFDTPEQQRRRQERDAEIGRLLRGDPEPAVEQVIEPTPYTSPENRRKTLAARVRESVSDPLVREEIADKILKAEDEEIAYAEQQEREAAEIDKNMHDGYSKAAKDQAEVDSEVALNLARLDQRNVSGRFRTRLGDVFREAEAKLERAAKNARAKMDDDFWSKSTQGQLFDVTGVLIKGTVEYARAVKVGALLVATHGAKYSAWTADMVGEFGESIKPVLAKIYHDAKKNVQNVLKWSHERHRAGPEKGNLKYAPKKYSKPGALKRLRAILEELAAEGEAGRFWYEKTGKAILKMVGGNMEQARKLAGLLAIYSQGTAVGANTTNALKLWSIFQANPDMPIPLEGTGTLAGRFGRQDRLAIEWLKSKDSDEYFHEKFGDKVFPFFTNIMRQVDPKTYEYGQGVTIDLWMMRALGYDRSTPTTTQFAFGAVEIRMLAEKLGWERQQVQAAVWVAIKARWEFIQKRGKDQSVNRGFAVYKPAPDGGVLFEVVGETREEQIENEKKIIMLFRKEALAASIGEMTKKLDESKRDFSDYMEEHYATISWEAEPSSKLGLVFNQMPIEEKMALQYEISQILTNQETGREYLAEWLDLLGQNQYQGPGAWDGAIGAVTQNQVLAPPEHKTSTDKIKTVQKGTVSAMNGYSAILGYLLKQDAVAWHRPFYGQAKMRANGVSIKIPRYRKPGKLHSVVKRIYSAMIAQTEAAGYAQSVGLEFAPVVLDGEIRLMNFAMHEVDGEYVPIISNTEFHKIVEAALDTANISGDMELFQTDGGYVSNDWVENPNGEEYVEAINQNENARVGQAFERAKSQFEQRIAAVYEKHAEKYRQKGGHDAAVTIKQAGAKDPKLKRGYKRFRTFRQNEYSALEVKYMGGGIKGEERLRGHELTIASYPSKGFNKEVGLGTVEYVIDVRPADLYDANKDPLGLKAKSTRHTSFSVKDDGTKVPMNPVFDMHQYEKNIKAAGFLGYYTPKAEGNLKGQARFFYDLTVGDGAQATTLSMPEGPTITISENSFDEFEVREESGEIYYTDDPDDAIGTARRIWGSDITIEIVDEDGDRIRLIRPEVPQLQDQLAKARKAKVTVEHEAAKEEVSGIIRRMRQIENRADKLYDLQAMAAQDGVDITSDDALKGRLSEWLFKGTLDRMAAFDLDSPSAFLVTRGEWHKATPQRLLEQFRAMEAQVEELVKERNELSSVLKDKEGMSEALRAAAEIDPTVMRLGSRSPLLPSSELNASFEEFFSEWMDITEDNPIAPDERVFEYGSAVTLRPHLSQGVVWIDSIRSFERDSGAGSQALQFITELADKHGITLTLYAKPFETAEPGLDQDALISWYERNGFNKEFTDQMGEVSYKLTRVPQNGDRTFSAFRAGHAGSAITGLPMTDALKIANQFQDTMGISNVVVVRTANDLPRALKDAIFYMGHDSRGINGAFFADPISGPTIYIIAENMYNESTLNPSTQRMEETLLHETIGHFGLQALLGPKKYNQMMDGIIRAFPDDVKRRLKRIKGTGLQARRLAAEEVFAYMVQSELLGLDLSKLQMSFIEKMVAAFQHALVRLGWKKMSRNDMLNLMFRSLDFVQANDTETLQGRSIHVEQMRKSRLAFERSPVSNVTFSLKQDRIDDPDLDKFLSKISHGKSSRLTGLRDWWELRKDNLARSAEIEIFDQFAGIRHAEQDLGIFGAESGYISVRLTAGADVVIRSALENGVPVWDDDGSVSIKPDERGLMQILSNVSHTPEMLKMFEAFVVARRARRLSKTNRENLLQRKEIGAVLRYVRRNKLHKLFDQTAKDMAHFKEGVLDFAMDSGLIDPVSRKLWEHHDHIPFYRVLHGDKTGPMVASRLGRAKRVIHRLRGSTDTLKRPLDSIVDNLSMLIEASMKNRAMTEVVHNFNGTGIITKAPQAELSTALIPMAQVKDMLHEAGVALDQVGEEMLSGIQKLTSLQAPTAANIVSIMEQGKRKYYSVHDTGVMRGLDGVSPKQWTELMRILRAPKRFLTTMITRMPDFILKNWFRDMWHSMVLQRHGQVIPILNSATGWAMAIAENSVYKDVLSGGGLFDSGYVNASDPDRAHRKIRKGLIAEGRWNILDSPRKLGRFYMRIANGAENAHRLTVFQKTMKATGNRKLALFESRDLMDFSVRGANGLVRFLTETVPFWGARMQGIQRTGKAFAEAPWLTLARGLPITLATMALYGLNREDDRYKGLLDYDKYMYYHFFDVFEPGDHWRLPKPFEVGAVFSTTPEILMELMLSEEPDRGKAAARSMWWTVSEMLSLFPSVQTVMPPLELAMNKNLFTKAPIITEWEAKLDPKDRHGARTNLTMKAIAQAMPEWAPEFMRSPKQLEHLTRGYVASAMDYALAASDLVYRRATSDENEPPTMRWDETPFMKAFRRDTPSKYDKYTNSMYDVMEQANKIHNSINNLQKQNTDEADDRMVYLEERNAALIDARSGTSNAQKRVAALNLRANKVYADETMTADEKREELDDIYQERSDVARDVYDLRPGGKENIETKKLTPSYWDQIFKKSKKEQVDDLIGQSLPHTATLINDATITIEKLQRVA